VSTLADRGLRPVAELAADRPQVTLRYLSVCSGIEAATVAWHPLGWQPVAFSEIEPFPSAVLAHHYPSVPNLGDMTKFQEWPDEPVDLLVGGTPCQSFSVAGLRKGLEDPRGNLMLTYLAIAQRYRPRWLVWENVPGVLSSGGGRDFGTFLGALGELGYGWAYRVLDAQWFGVAQRRRRVFVVGHLGDWQRAAQVLFERESVRRDSPPSREAREAVAGTIAARFGISRNNHEELAWSECVGGGPDGGRIAGTVSSKWSKGSGGPAGDECYNMVAHALRAEGFDASEDGTGRGTPLVPVVFKVRGGVEREDGSRGSTNIGKQAGKGYLGSEERAFTLAAAQDQFVAQPVAFHNRQDPDVSGDITHPLGAKDNGMAVAQPIPFRKSRRAKSVDDHETWVEDGVSNTLNCFDVGDVRAVDVVAQPVAFSVCPDHCGGDKSGQDVAFVNVVDVSRTLDCTGADVARKQGGIGIATAMQVRRLTPVECERLQGFPDGYTNIPWRKKDEAPDGPRYKALGNSMAVPCMAWIGKRIAEVDRGD
jgi:DNA (cytosine-5)-methyltransferase 1